jgi:hypothetical protein
MIEVAKIDVCEPIETKSTIGNVSKHTRRVRHK